MGADELFERFLNHPLLLFHFAAQAVECDAGVIGYGAVRQNFS